MENIFNKPFDHFIWGSLHFCNLQQFAKRSARTRLAFIDYWNDKSNSLFHSISHISFFPGIQTFPGQQKICSKEKWKSYWIFPPLQLYHKSLFVTSVKWACCSYLQIIEAILQQNTKSPHKRIFSSDNFNFHFTNWIGGLNLIFIDLLRKQSGCWDPGILRTLETLL